MNTTPSNATSTSTHLPPLPWLPVGVVRFLDDKLAGLSIFEWGSGGSTLWFAQRAASVVSVEHDEEWYKRVDAARRAVEQCNITLIHCLLGPAYWNDIRLFEPDFVVIDGRHRKACAAAVRMQTPPPAAILWDDAQRPYYQCSMHYDGYAHRDFLDDEHPRTSRLFVKLDGRLKHWLD